MRRVGRRHIDAWAGSQRDIERSDHVIGTHHLSVGAFLLRDRRWYEDIHVADILEAGAFHTA
jgi:hypothetical protein